MTENAFVHPSALCESPNVGSGTRVWAFAHILAGATVGKDCNICDNVFIENQVVIGDRVTIKCGVQLWDGVQIEDDVFVGPNVTFTNDPFPRSGRHLLSYPKTIVRKGASIGGNATILPGVEIGAGAMVGAGSVVVRSVPPHATVVGNPARIIGYTETVQDRLVADDIPDFSGQSPASVSLGVADATLYRTLLVRDLRGNLTVGEVGKDIPFVPQRYFVVFDVLSEEVRGEHAHRRCQQFLVCLKGCLRVVLDDGNRRRLVMLNRPDLGLYVPPMVWSTQFQHSSDAILMVLASHAYDSEDYIRNYGEFLEIVDRVRGNQD